MKTTAYYVELARNANHAMIKAAKQGRVGLAGTHRSSRNRRMELARQA